MRLAFPVPWTSSNRISSNPAPRSLRLGWTRAAALFLLVAPCLASSFSYAAENPTHTSLEITAPGPAAPHPVTLTATVTADGGHVSPGFVTFCDASTRPCLDWAILGTVAVLRDGKATLKKVLPPGVYGIYAIYNGTQTNASSESQITSVEVQSSTPALTTTSIGKASNGPYVTVQAQVTSASAVPLQGSVSLYVDSTSSFLQSILNSLYNGESTEITRAAITTNFGPLASYADPETGNDLSLLQLYWFGGRMPVADFNGDGLPDTAVSVAMAGDDGDGTYLRVYLNDPDHPGQFLKGPIAAGAGALVGDFNGDGIPDLEWSAVETNSNGPGVKIKDYISFGEAANPGQFTTGTPINGYTPFEATADLNHDGTLDLISVDTILFNDPLNEGKIFKSASLPSLGATDIAVADLNGDGLPDLVETLPNGLALLINDPTQPGHFLAPVIYSTGAITLAGPAVFGDFSTVGQEDIAVLANDSGVAVFRNFFGYQFGPLLGPVYYPAGSGASGLSSLVVGQFRGTKTLDLALKSTPVPDGPSTAYLIPEDPAYPSTFDPAVAYPLSASNQTYSLTAADWNADGYFDLASSSYNPNTGDDSLDTSLEQVTQSSTAAFSNLLVYSPPDLAHVQFTGTPDFLPSSSCSIDIYVLFPKPPAFSNVVALPVSSTSENISWSGGGSQVYLSYGPTAALGSTIGPFSEIPSAGPAPNPILLQGLEPGTQYFYQLTGTSYASGCVPLKSTAPILEFTTQP